MQRKLDFKTLVGEIKISYSNRIQPETQIKNSESAFEFIKPVFDSVTDISIREAFLAIYLNRSNKVIAYQVVSLGGISGTVVDTRLILKAGLDCLASSIILTHNHPSGNLKPSEADLSITKRIKEAAKLLEFNIIDHIIINPENQYYSMGDEGLL